MPWLTFIGSKYTWLEQFSMFLRVFEPLKFDCTMIQGFLKHTVNTAQTTDVQADLSFHWVLRSEGTFSPLWSNSLNRIYFVQNKCVKCDSPEQPVHPGCLDLTFLAYIFRPQGYKTFFMLNSAEHETCPVNKSQITNNCKLHFFFLLNIAEHENFSAYKYENAN